MRMDGFSNVVRFAPHFDGKANFTYQVPGVRTNNTTTNNAMGILIEQEFRETFIAPVGDGSA